MSAAPSRRLGGVRAQGRVTGTWTCTRTAMGGPLIRASEVVLLILDTISHELPAQAMASKEARLRAISLYKELHRLGREYPDPAYVSSSGSHTTKYSKLVS